MHRLVVAIVLFAVTSLAVATAFLQASAPALAAAPQAPQSSGLPDGRVYELVSTLGEAGEPYQPTYPLEVGVENTEHPYQAAQNGEAITYVGEPPAVGGTGETGPGEGDQWLANRTPAGWVPHVITPALANVEFPAFQAFSLNLTNGIFQGGGEPLVPGVPVGCRTLYSRLTATGAYNAVFTNTEAPEGSESPTPCGHPLYAGASESEASIVFQSEALLTPSAEPPELPPGRTHHSETGQASAEPCMYGCNLYDATNGHLTLVNVLEGKPVASAVLGGYPGGEVGFTDLSNVISADGSRIFWTDTQSGPDFEHVFVLEDGQNNVQVSGAGSAQYWTATPDGALAFYTEEGELWKFDTRTNARERLTSEEAAVFGVIGTNQTGEDGSYVYLVALGALAANENAEGQTAEPGEPNLYLIHGGTTTFISRLEFGDDEFRATSEGGLFGGDWMPDMGLRTAGVTPDGRHLVFQSVLPITGYNNEVPGGHVAEVFVYSATGGELACTSCDPAGAAPSVLNERAGLNPPETRLPVSHQSFVHMRRWMSDNGSRVFFTSEQPLVAQDTNGVQDVYEWEREGAGTCAAVTPARANHGCVFLLSGGNNRGYSFLVDADSTGNNVFIEHQGALGQALVAEDRNELYDVRVSGGFPEVGVNCAGSSCEASAPPAPNFSTPGSVTSSGGGNFPPRPQPKPLTRAQKLAKALKACKSKHKHKRARCEREARQRYGPQHASRAKRSQKRGSK